MTKPRARPGRHIRFAAEYAVFLLMVGLMKPLGLDRASAVSGAAWRLIAPRTKRHAAALRHLQVAFPDATEEERERIAREVWTNLGRTTAETLFGECFIREPSRIRLVSPEVMKTIEKAKGRVVVASMHYANWELIAPAFKAAGFPMAFIYQRVNNPHAEDFLRRLRLNFFPGGVYPKGETAPRKLIAWLRTGNPVLILADQRTGDIPAHFFGHEAPSTPLPAFMARTLDAPLIAARLVRTDGARFDLVLEEVPVRRTKDRDGDVAAVTQDLQSLFEIWIREMPGQWMWHHRRWTHRGPPAGWKPGKPVPETKTRGPKAARQT